MGPVAEEEPRIAERVTEDESVELIDYLLVLWKYRWMIGMGVVAVMAAAAALTWMTPRTYQASTLIKVGTMFVPGRGDGANVLVLIEDPKTISQVLTGDAMILRLKNFLGLDRMSVSSLKQAVVVKVVKNDVSAGETNLLDVSLKLNDPQHVLNGLNFLVGQVVNEHKSRYEAGLAVIDREAQGLQEKIVTSRVQLENLQKKIAEVRQLMSTEARYRQDLATRMARIEEEIGQGRLRFSKEKPGSTDALLAQGLFQSLEIHLNDLKVEENASYVRTREWQTQIYDLEMNVASLNERTTDFQNGIVQLAGYRARAENTKMRSEPILPTMPVGPKRTLNIAVAGIVGFMVFVLLAFLREYLQNARRRVYERALLQ
jgi:uncharacterized protein involved in exopolysaccharide biosynthesis